MLVPIRIATSRAALKAYVNTAIFAATSAVLFVLASCAYILFYINYIPTVGFEQVAHLQFQYAQSNRSPDAYITNSSLSDGPNPWTMESLKHSLVPQQAYDIAVQIDLPRSKPNLEMGNFMVNLLMISPTWKPVVDTSSADNWKFDPRTWIPKDTILFSSRRPAILTYHSKVVTLGKQLWKLPSYVLGWRKEHESLDIHIADGVSFDKGWRNLPTKVYLDLQTRGHNIEVYSMKLVLRARFSGIRWLMYNHRIFSFFIFTGAFWAAEMMFALLALLGIHALSGPRDQVKPIKNDDYTDDDATRIKAENEEDMDDLDLSDTARSFPTYGRQAPLQYIPKIKQEEDSEEMVSDEAQSHPRTAEADDES